MGAGRTVAAKQAFVNPESVLARTARQMLEAHGGGRGPSDGYTICPACGEWLPCPVARAAAEVVIAAGLAEASGLVEAARQGRGPHAAAHAAPVSPAAPPSAASAAPASLVSPVSAAFSAPSASSAPSA